MCVCRVVVVVVGGGALYKHIIWTDSAQQGWGLRQPGTEVS